MLANKGYFVRLVSFSVLVLTAGLLAAYAQDQTLADIKYKDDYERLQRVVRVTAPIKRVEQLLAFYRDRSDADPKLRDYADNFFARDMDSLTKQANYVAMRGLCERALKIRPKFGEAYFYFGIVLKNEGKAQEAMNAFAKCHLIKNPFQTKAKQQLDILYRKSSGGSLIGENKIVDAARKELK